MKERIILAIIEDDLRTEILSCDWFPGKNKEERAKTAGRKSVCKLLLSILERHKNMTEEELKEIVKANQPYGRFKDIEID